MKNVLTILLAATMIFALGSCSKEAPNQAGNNPYYVPGGNNGNTGGNTGGDPDPAPSSPVGDVPLNFTKKIIIEKMTGEWCGACPNGGNIIDGIVSSNAGKVFSASWQMSNNDPFEIPEAQIWRSHISAGAGLSGFSFPSASINRATSITASYANAALDKNESPQNNWATQTATELAKTPECGLALVTSEQDDKVSVDVYVGYNNPIATANTHVTIFLIEDNVPESAPNAQAGGGGSYMHHNMIRDVLTADLGDPISLSAASTTKYVKHEIKDFDIAGKYHDKSNLKILAFVNVKGAVATDLAILNAQEVVLGETKKFD